MHLKSTQHALGFRVKSGWATSVLVEGTIQSIEVVDCRIIELSDPAIPDSRQPYHVLEDRPGPSAEKEVQHLLKVVAHTTKNSVSHLLRDYQRAGHKIFKAGLIVGSLIDPATIKNTHIRAHALEGKLFRNVVEDALSSQGISTSAVIEKNCYSTASQILNQSENELRRTMAGFKNSVPVQWRANEKAACLAAWMAIGG